MTPNAAQREACMQTARRLHRLAHRSASPEVQIRVMAALLAEREAAARKPLVETLLIAEDELARSADSCAKVAPGTCCITLKGHPIKCCCGDALDRVRAALSEVR